MVVTAIKSLFRWGSQSPEAQKKLEAEADALFERTERKKDDAPACDKVRGLFLLSQDMITRNSGGVQVVYPDEAQDESSFRVAIAKKYSEKLGIMSIFIKSEGTYLPSGLRDGIFTQTLQEFQMNMMSKEVDIQNEDDHFVLYKAAFLDVFDGLKEALKAKVDEWVKEDFQVQLVHLFVALKKKKKVLIPNRTAIYNIVKTELSTLNLNARQLTAYFVLIKSLDFSPSE